MKVAIYRWMFILIPLLLIPTSSNGWDIPFLSKKITLSSENGTKKFSYKCGDFEHQIEMREDILDVLIYNLRITSEDAVENDRYATASSLRAAWEQKDTIRMEKLIVEYKCKHK